MSTDSKQSVTRGTTVKVYSLLPDHNQSLLNAK